MGSIVAVVVVLMPACGSGGDDGTLESTDPTVDTSVAGTIAVGGTDGSSSTIDPIATISIAEHVDGGLVTADAVWASVDEADTLYRIDPATNRVVEELPAPGLGFRFDIGHGAAWVTDFEASVVRRIDLDDGTVVEIPTGANPEGIAVTDTAVWVANHRGGSVTRIDPVTNAVVATIEVGLAGPAGPQPIEATDDRVWVGVPNLGQVVVIDPATDAVVAAIDTAATCGEIQLIDDAVWVTNCFESDDVTVIDRATDSVRGEFHAGELAGTPVQVGSFVWLPTIHLEPDVSGEVVQVDPSTLEIVEAIVTDPSAFVMGQGFDSVWQFSWDGGAVIRLPIDAFTTPGG